MTHNILVLSATFLLYSISLHFSKTRRRKKGQSAVWNCNIFCVMQHTQSDPRLRRVCCDCAFLLEQIQDLFQPSNRNSIIFIKTTLLFSSFLGTNSSQYQQIVVDIECVLGVFGVLRNVQNISHCIIKSLSGCFEIHSQGLSYL